VINVACLSIVELSDLSKLSEEESFEFTVIDFADCTEDVAFQFSTKSSIESDKTD
jgi:hypothetical protein